MRKLKLLLISATLSCCMSITAFAGQWVDDNRCYIKDNGVYANKEWVYIDGKWFWFSEGINGHGYLPSWAGFAADGYMYNGNGEYVDMTVEGMKYASEELYNQIQDGMSYEQVVSILGKEHEISNIERRQIGSQTFDYLQVKWYSEDANSDIRITFKNGILHARHATWR